MQLNEIRDNPKARKNKRRVGRGIGSGKGKTCGAGVKGQKARTGVAIKGFEGGQMPLQQRLPKRGFKNIFSTQVGIVNLGSIQGALDSGKLSCDREITLSELQRSGVVRKNVSFVKLLGKGELKKPVFIKVHFASQSAQVFMKNIKGTLEILGTERVL